MKSQAVFSTNGQVIFYADQITESIRKAVGETNRRRKIQMAFNKKFQLEPKTIKKPLTVASLLEIAGFQKSEEDVDTSLVEEE